MPVEFDHERTAEYQAALALHNHLIHSLPPRRGFGVTRSHIERQLVLALVRVADAMARPESDNFVRHLEKADSSCTRVVALLQSLKDRSYVDNEVLEKGRELSEALQLLLRRHFKKPVAEPSDTSINPDERRSAGGPRPAPASEPSAPTNGFRSHPRRTSRPQRRARLQ